MKNITRRSALTLGLAAGAGAGTLTGAGAAAAAAAMPGVSGRNPVLRNGGLHHVAVRTRDYDKTLGFYQRALGFTVKLAWKESSGSVDDRRAASGTRLESFRWAYLDSGDGTCIEIFEDPDFVPPAANATDPTKNPGSPVVHFGLRTSQLDKVVENVRAHGGTVAGAPGDFTLHTTTGQGAVVVRICFIQGPSGEWIELLQNAP